MHVAAGDRLEYRAVGFRSMRAVPEAALPHQRTKLAERRGQLPAIEVREAECLQAG